MTEIKSYKEIKLPESIKAWKIGGIVTLILFILMLITVIPQEPDQIFPVLVWGIISIVCFIVSASKNRELSEIVEKRKRRKELVAQEKKEKEKKAERIKQAEIKLLKKKFGENYGKLIYDTIPTENMTKDMIRAIDSRSGLSPIYNSKEDEIEKWFYAPYTSLGVDFIISFVDDKVSEIDYLDDGIWLDMPKEMLIAACGDPEDEKKDVSKKGTKLKWYYAGRTTRQGTTAYKYEVRLENDLVVGWKELE